MAVQEHVYRTGLGQPFTWLDAFRFPLVEYLFWAVAAPLIFDAALRYPLHRKERRWPNLLTLMAVCLLTCVLHALYRAPLHSFVYPAGMWSEASRGFPKQFLFYFVNNFSGDVWMFATIMALAYVALYYQQYRELQLAQLQMLRAQLQPHFFFNTLNSIATLMHEDVNAADEMMTNLATLLRRSLREDSEYEIPLREELEILNLYLDIERCRFADRLQVSIDTPPESLQAQVPTLFLQPLVENALHHGIAKRPGPGVIDIRARVARERLHITVTNDGPVSTSDDLRREGGIGLANTRARLRRHYGEQHEFDLRPRAQGGVVASIEIPFRTVQVEAHV